MIRENYYNLRNLLSDVIHVIYCLLGQTNDGHFPGSKRRILIDNYLYKIEISILRTYLLVWRDVGFTTFYRKRKLKTLTHPELSRWTTMECASSKYKL